MFLLLYKCIDRNNNLKPGSKYNKMLIGIYLSVVRLRVILTVLIIIFFIFKIFYNEHTFKFYSKKNLL